MTGIILLNKPRNLSSNMAANIVKRVVGAKKAGHLGTLDNAAEGLLPITLNSSTKLFDIFLNKDKEYSTLIKFGETSPSFDLETEVTKGQNVNITKSDIEKALPKLIGKLEQMPPVYSAKKIAGAKAYDLARQGKDVALKPKLVEVYDFSIIEQVDNNLFRFKIHCSSGTYVRALARDLATELSTCAVCYDIIRTRCGVLCLKDAQSLEEIKSGNIKIISPDSLFNLPRIDLTQEEQERLLNGQILNWNLLDGEYKLYRNDFLGIGEIKNSKLKLKLRLN